MSSRTRPQLGAQPNKPYFNPQETGTDLFFYGGRVTGLSSAAPNGSIIINLDADSNFLCVAMSYQADIAVAALTESTNLIPLVNVQITDTGSGRAMMNTPVPITTIMGDGKRPYRLPRPRLFFSNSTISFAFTAYVVAGTTYNISVAMHGFKQYKG